MGPSVAYLGPQGTFSEEALLAGVQADSVEPVACETIYDAVMAVDGGEVEFALVPIENSLEGSVTVTLDTLVGDGAHTRIVGETLLAVRHCLIASEPVELAEIDTVVSHPHVPGQCARFLRGELAHAHVRAASSTAEAVRQVAEAGAHGWAAIGTRLAAEIYGCEVLREGIQDRSDNETRFVWLARDGAGQAPLIAPPGSRPLKTSLVFWGPGADHPGWLVRCLSEFADREINLTKIESRPQRERSWRYMFFLDMEGAVGEERIDAAIGGLRGRCEVVRVLGSYHAA